MAEPDERDGENDLVVPAKYAGTTNGEPVLRLATNTRDADPPADAALSGRPPTAGKDAKGKCTAGLRAVRDAEPERDAAMTSSRGVASRARRRFSSGAAAVIAVMAALVASCATLAAGPAAASVPVLEANAPPPPAPPARPTNGADPTVALSNRCTSPGINSNPNWQYPDGNNNVLCTVPAKGYRCPAGTSGCTVTLTSFQLAAKAANPSLDVTIHGWLQVNNNGTWTSRLPCNSVQKTSYAACGGKAQPFTVPAGGTFVLVIGGSLLISGIAPQRTGTITTTAALSVSYSECPCWLSVFVNGDYGEYWGIGIVSMSPEPVPPRGNFQAGSWAAQFNNSAACWNGNDAVGPCNAVGVWSPATLTLTAHAVPKGGLSPNELSDNPSYSSEFVSWGGDCASAGGTPTCTLHLGTQRNPSGGYSLSVTANFRAVPPGTSGF